LCFINLAEWAYFKESEPLSTWQTVICRKLSFEKLTQLSQANNVLDNAASNTDGFFTSGE
jgi:hypothetical protein